MTHVVVTIKKIKDLEAFREYAVQAQPLVERHGGRYVGVDKTPALQSGGWPYVRTIIVSYPNFAAAQKFYDSPEYRAIVPIRERAIDANIVLVRDPEEAGIDMDPRKSGA
jgi:uncharacterized protein (DUF1330 family)